jgi:hypothetical protein
MSLQEILSTLRSDAIQSLDVQSLMKKYDMLFLGEKANVINSIELRHTIKNYFKTEISIEELNMQLPSVCTSLNMIAEPMKALDDMANPNPACYQISLF